MNRTLIDRTIGFLENLADDVREDITLLEEDRCGWLRQNTEGRKRYQAELVDTIAALRRFAETLAPSPPPAIDEEEIAF